MPLITLWVPSSPSKLIPVKSTLVAFHSCTFSALELNYDTHDKELLAIFEAFHVWQRQHLGCDTGVGHTVVLWSWVTQVQVWFQISRPKATPQPIIMVSWVLDRSQAQFIVHNFFIFLFIFFV